MHHPIKVILIYQANGGNGGGDAGGGGGGRIGVNWYDEMWWFGTLQTKGGTGSRGVGGAGTIFLDVSILCTLHENY